MGSVLIVEEELRIESVSDILRAADKAVKVFGHAEPWWRGQDVWAWSLTPHVFRPLASGRKGQEPELVARFMDGAPARYPNCPRDEQYDRWLLLMQHYGLPTRLLDWTDSPLVATYFAAQDRNCQNEDAALWALCPKRLNHHQAQRKEILSPTEEPALSVIRGAFSDVPQVGEVAPPTDYNALAIRTPSIDIRMLTQLSRFTVHGLARALDSLDLRKAVPATGGIRRRPRRDHGTEPFLLKFPIDAKAKPDLPQWLYGLGIRRAGLFPDLQNLSAELRDLAGFGDSS